MKKHLSLLLVSIVITTVSVSQNIQDSIGKINNVSYCTNKNCLNLKGKVKTLTSTDYKIITKSKGIQKKEMAYKKFDSLDVNGNIVLFLEYNAKGILTQKDTYKYDDKGNKIEQNGQKIKKVKNNKSNKYDDKGNTIEEDIYNPDGSLYKKETYIYDDKKNITEQNIYKKGDSLDSKETFKYDNKGNKIEHNIYNSKGFLMNKIISKYDEKTGKYIGGDYHEYYDGKDTLALTEIYKWDDKGFLLEQDYSDGLKIKYVHDNNGNYIKSSQFRNDVPTKIIEREIIYY